MSLLLPAYSVSGQQLGYSVALWNADCGFIPKEAIFIRIFIPSWSGHPELVSPLCYLKWSCSSALYRISMWHHLPSLLRLLSTPLYSRIVRLSAPTTCLALCNFIISQQSRVNLESFSPSTILYL